MHLGYGTHGSPVVVEPSLPTWFSLRRIVLSLSLIVMLAPPAHAGQVRVDLNATAFSPSNVTVNAGDHVVWVWLAGDHSVTSGNPNSPSGLFDSGIRPTGTLHQNTAYSYMTFSTGVIPYHCVPHADFGMTGTINVVATDEPVAEFRITEVLYNAEGGADLIEISNLGGAAGDLGRYRIAISGVVEDIRLASLPVGPNGVVTILPGRAGEITVNEVFMPSLPTLPDTGGSVALYVPNVVATSLGDPTQIIDYVSWGSAGQENENTAVGAGIWLTGQSVPLVGAVGRSIEFCGGPDDYGRDEWAEITSPNFGFRGDCSTPTATATWGTVKARYR